MTDRKKGLVFWLCSLIAPVVGGLLGLGLIPLATPLAWGWGLTLGALAGLNIELTRRGFPLLTFILTPLLPSMFALAAGGDALTPFTGLFYGGGMTLLIAQIVGVVAVGAFTFIGSYAVWTVIKVALGLRVSPEEEARGLDLSEMGMEAYAGDVSQR